MQEWSHSVVVTDETVKVVKEYLELQNRFGSSKKTHKNTASAYDISEFLGWKESKVGKIFQTLNLFPEKSQTMINLELTT